MRRRADVSEREQLRRFLTWLTGKASQSELTGDSGRTFRRATAWCWQLEPRMPVTGEVHDAVLVDGVWIGSWCLLIAQSSTGTVIAWQWAARETTAAWEALFAQIPPHPQWSSPTAAPESAPPWPTPGPTPSSNAASSTCN